MIAWARTGSFVASTVNSAGWLRPAAMVIGSSLVLSLTMLKTVENTDCWSLPSAAQITMLSPQLTAELCVWNFTMGPPAVHVREVVLHVNRAEQKSAHQGLDLLGPTRFEHLGRPQGALRPLVVLRTAEVGERIQRPFVRCVVHQVDCVTIDFLGLRGVRAAGRRSVGERGRTA